MANNINVSSLIPSEVNNTLSNIKNPKSFGDQIIDNSKQKLLQSSLGKIEEIKSQIQDIVLRLVNLEVDHAKNLQDLINQLNPPPPTKPTLSVEEYQEAVNIENLSYQQEKQRLQEVKVLLQERLNNILNDPLKNIKLERQKLKNKIKISKLRIKNKENKEKKRLSLKVLKSAAKSLAPIIALQGTKLLFSIITSNKRIQNLIDNTNTIIEAATTRQAIENARVIRNSTLNAINENERKLESLRKLITNLNRVITILNLVLSIIILLFTIPKPFGLGPTMPTPVANRVKKLQDIIFALNVNLSVIQGILDAKLENLRDLRSQLLNINNLLDNKTLNTLSDNEIQDFINDLRNQSNDINSNSSNQFGEYKGFKFAIKEEETTDNQQAVVVRGTIKRRYAVAIDKDGIEVLKSELSFTLDPQDLVEQLKIIIDQQNLQA
jgi:hypothetical protein